MAEAHEFVASGVIVHNCVWGLVACKIEGSGMSWLDVYAPAKDDQGNVKRRDDEPPNPWADTYGQGG